MNRRYASFAFAAVSALAATASADPADRFPTTDRRPFVRPAFERMPTVRPSMERVVLERPRFTEPRVRPVLERPQRPLMAPPAVQRATGTPLITRAPSDARATALPANRWGDLRALKAHIEKFIANIKAKNDSESR